MNKLSSLLPSLYEQAIKHTGTSASTLSSVQADKISLVAYYHQQMRHREQQHGMFIEMLQTCIQR
jgi:hypothetical protein